jgi:hypothetical protein
MCIEEPRTGTGTGGRSSFRNCVAPRDYMHECASALDCEYDGCRLEVAPGCHRDGYLQRPRCSSSVCQYEISCNYYDVGGAFGLGGTGGRGGTPSMAGASLGGGGASEGGVAGQDTGGQGGVAGEDGGGQGGVTGDVGGEGGFAGHG